MAKDVAACVCGEHQIELGLQLWITSVILELEESQKQEQLLRVCAGVMGKGFETAHGFAMLKVAESLGQLF